MFTINSRDKSPIYEQIMDQIVLFVSTGVMASGDKLPSIRELASELGINPNTVARAYGVLEQRGVIETIPKKGAFVVEKSLRPEIENSAREDLVEVYVRYRQFGLPVAKLTELAKEAFEYAEHNRLT